MKFILGAVCGLIVGAMVGAYHPSATKEAYKSSVNTATTAVAEVATATQKVANEQLAKAGK